MAYVAYDPAKDLMIYDRAGGVIQDFGTPWIIIGYTVEEIIADIAILSLRPMRKSYNSGLGVWEIELEIDILLIPDGFVPLNFDAGQLRK